MQEKSDDFNTKMKLNELRKFLCWVWVNALLACCIVILKYFGQIGMCTLGIILIWVINLNLTIIFVKNYHLPLKINLLIQKKNGKLYSEFITKYNECIMSGINESLSFSTEGIEKTTGSLNLCKTADCENLTAEHVIFAHPSDYVCLKESFDLCIKHGYCPSIMRTGIIRSII